MRILITGYTTRMWGSNRVPMDYITFSYKLEEILKELGHEVHRRGINIGEDIAAQFDFAFCGVAPLSSMTSAKVPETHYVMDRMFGKHIVYADDWSFCGFGDSMKYTLPRWGKYLQYKNFKYDKETVEATRLSLERMIDSSSLLNATVLAPMFPWGNHKFLMANNYDAKLMTVDPSAWVEFPTIEIPTPKQRIRQWVVAALSDHTAWVKRQGFKLPVNYVGNKRMGVPVLSENSTVKLFAQSFGVVSVGYPSAGSGWWRTRYLNAAWAETPIYSDPRDAATMGKAYQGTVEEFENIISDTEFRDRVESQAVWLNNNIASKEWVLAIMEKLLKA